MTGFLWVTWLVLVGLLSHVVFRWVGQNRPPGGPTSSNGQNPPTAGPMLLNGQQNPTPGGPMSVNGHRSSQEPEAGGAPTPERSNSHLEVPS